MSHHTFDMFNVADPTSDTYRTLGDSQKDKGTQIFESMLLNQYQNSPNLKAYIQIFIDEMDLLFSEIEEVYYGRFIDSAVGAQLDVIGEILQQNRAVELPLIWFGFDGAPGAAGMVDESNPSIGGIFRSEESEGFEVTPLPDNLYRRVLLTKAMVLTGEEASINTVYDAIITTLGRVPNGLELENIGHRAVQLNLPSTGITTADLQLVLYMSKYFIPVGVSFTISVI